jgi:hypothetical protein
MSGVGSEVSEIGADMLPGLTEADLEKLGVPLGAPQAAPQSHLRVYTTGSPLPTCTLKAV